MCQSRALFFSSLWCCLHKRSVFHDNHNAFCVLKNNVPVAFKLRLAKTKKNHINWAVSPLWQRRSLIQVLRWISIRQAVRSGRCVCRRRDCAGSQGVNDRPPYCPRPSGLLGGVKSGLCTWLRKIIHHFTDTRVNELNPFFFCFPSSAVSDFSRNSQLQMLCEDGSAETTIARLLVNEQRAKINWKLYKKQKWKMFSEISEKPQKRGFTTCGPLR